MAPPTILAHKSAFLTVQTLHLSQSLAPSTVWRNRANNNSENDGASSIPQRAIDDALFRLNQNLQQHVRRVYPPQATRQVAEQIDSLFLGAGEDEGGGDDDAMRDGDEGLRALKELDELREGIDLSTFSSQCAAHSITYPEDCTVH